MRTVVLSFATNLQTCKLACSCGIKNVTSLHDALRRACRRALTGSRGKAEWLLNKIETKSGSITVPDCFTVEQQRKNVKFGVSGRIAAANSTGFCGLDTPAILHESILDAA
jgi:hypothetical protein